MKIFIYLTILFNVLFYLNYHFFVKIILDNQYKRYYNEQANKAKRLAFTCGVSSARVNTFGVSPILYCCADGYLSALLFCAGDGAENFGGAYSSANRNFRSMSRFAIRSCVLSERTVLSWV